MEPGRDDREDMPFEKSHVEGVLAAMEPGRDDREDVEDSYTVEVYGLPQWSPVVMTGKTLPPVVGKISWLVPQWSPVVMTGKTRISEDQRYVVVGPQWSPVVMTGKTARLERST